jgi:hypothetical protein
MHICHGDSYIFDELFSDLTLLYSCLKAWDFQIGLNTYLEDTSF